MQKYCEKVLGLRHI